MKTYILIYNDETVLYSGKQSEMAEVTINSNTRIETFSCYQDLYDRTSIVEDELLKKCPDPLIYYKELLQISRRLFDIKIDLYTNRKALFELGETTMDSIYNSFTDVINSLRWDIIDPAYCLASLEELVNEEEGKGNVEKQEN